MQSRRLKPRKQSVRTARLRVRSEPTVKIVMASAVPTSTEMSVRSSRRKIDPLPVQTHRRKRDRASLSSLDK